MPKTTAKGFAFFEAPSAWHFFPRNKLMNRTALLWVGLLASLTLLSGCAAGPDLKGQPFFTAVEQAQPEQATLYFYRPAASVGYFVTPTITINGNAVGVLPSGGFFRTTVPAGSYRIESTTPPFVSSSVNKRFDLNVESGHVYFIADETSSRAFGDDHALGEVNDAYYSGAHFYFRYALVPAEEALRTIKWCQQVPVAVK
jgi:hypothetical protein